MSILLHCRGCAACKARYSSQLQALRRAECRQPGKSPYRFREFLNRQAFQDDKAEHQLHVISDWRLCHLQGIEFVPSGASVVEFVCLTLQKLSPIGEISLHDYPLAPLTM